MILKEFGKYGKKKYYIDNQSVLYISKDDSVFEETQKLLTGSPIDSFMINVDLNNFAEKISDKVDLKTWEKYENYEVIQMYSKQLSKTKFSNIFVLSNN